MLENEENKMNTENNESEVKNESNIENVETVKNDAEDSATNKATEEMFEESDFVTPPQDVEETADAAQADTVQTSETDQTQNCEAQTDEDHIKGTEGASRPTLMHLSQRQYTDDQPAFVLHPVRKCRKILGTVCTDFQKIQSRIQLF